ncbi:MAG: monovalent cation/H+ antiporter subunit D family protein [Beijerinckiaceae bacterium]|nr:monovalent cation/H+ antiporter subunit D family protein [Beijerinckiaceae bacterium]
MSAAASVFDVKAHLPALQIVVPMIGAVLCAFLKRGTVAWTLALAVSWVAALISAALLQQVLASGTISYALGGWAPPYGIEYRVDTLSAFILFLVAWSGAIIMVYARNSVDQEISENSRSWFYTMYLLCLTGLLGITITGDAFNAFVFMEVSSLAMYTLIAMGRHRRALLSAYQYLIMGTIGATFYIIGVGMLFTITGSLNFVDIAARLASTGMERPAIAGLAFLTVGISLKLALFPLHAWLPNAYAYAPSVITAFLAGTATKVAIYLLIRIFSVYGGSTIFRFLPISEILLLLSVAAMIGASLVAVFQDNVKRVLAYSSVAQVGYITLGIALANQSGLTAATVHMFNHAVIKTALFLAIGAAVYRTGTLRLHDLDGIGPRMPLTMMSIIVGGLALIGTPGTAGFISKYYLAVGALDKGWWWLVFIIVISSFIAVLYAGKMIEAIWFREPSEFAKQASDPPLAMLLPILFLTAAIIWFGFDTRLTVDIASKAAEALLGGVK